MRRWEPQAFMSYWYSGPYYELAQQQEAPLSDASGGTTEPEAPLEDEEPAPAPSPSAAAAPMAPVPIRWYVPGASPYGKQRSRPQSPPAWDQYAYPNEKYDYPYDGPYPPPPPQTQQQLWYHHWQQQQQQYGSAGPLSGHWPSSSFEWPPASHAVWMPQSTAWVREGGYGWAAVADGTQADVKPTRGTRGKWYLRLRQHRSRLHWARGTASIPINLMLMRPTTTTTTPTRLLLHRHTTSSTCPLTTAAEMGVAKVCATPPACGISSAGAG